MPAPRPGVALVPGELRGYRQFELRDDGLYPLVHSRLGPWDADLERARCAVGGAHAAPGTDCRCGLYGWYLPGSATVSLGPVSAVVAARGRCVLGDRGFRAAAARIEAVALPATVRWNPRAASRARRMLGERYPRTRVYGSVRQMLKEHPPHAVDALGIRPPQDHSRGYRAALVATWVAGLALIVTLAVLKRVGIAQGYQDWWPVLVLFAVAWQAGLVWLITQLLRLQMPDRGEATGGRG